MFEFLLACATVVLAELPLEPLEPELEIAKRSAEPIFFKGFGGGRGRGHGGYGGGGGHGHGGYGHGKRSVDDEPKDFEDEPLLPELELIKRSAEPIFFKGSGGGRGHGA